MSFASPGLTSTDLYLHFFLDYPYAKSSFYLRMFPLFLDFFFIIETKLISLINKVDPCGRSQQVLCQSDHCFCNSVCQMETVVLAAKI